MRNTVWMGQAPLQVPGRVVVVVVVAVVIGQAALPKEAVASRKERERLAARSPRAGKRKASSFTHLLPTGYSSHAIRHPSITDVTRPMAAQRDDFLHGPDSAGTDRAPEQAARRPRAAAPRRRQP